MREVLDEIPGLKLTYLGGALELMSPSPEHEVVKKRIARLVELFALERNVPLYGYGLTMGTVDHLPPRGERTRARAGRVLLPRWRAA